MTIDILLEVALEFEKLNIQSFIVGGWVRDKFMGIQNHDIDVCLVGVKDISDVMLVLSKFTDNVAQEVGSSFPVWIADLEGKVDFALARAERKVEGGSRKDFLLDIENVTIEDDLSRRDLTVNSIAIEITTGEVVDPFGGIEDIELGFAHPTTEAFAEDLLRVVRAARFIARFKLIPTQQLLDICSSLDPTVKVLDSKTGVMVLPVSLERVGDELTKVMKQAEKPSIFFEFLRQVGWLGHYFKELEDLIGVQQDPIHHPEGDAYVHTLHCMDSTEDPFIRIVMLCHDLGKATKTQYNKEKQKWQAIGHEKEVHLTETLLNRVKWGSKKLISQVMLLVELHMYGEVGLKKSRVRKTKRKLVDIGLTYKHLADVCFADHSGRPPLVATRPNLLDDFAESYDTAPIVTGQMILDLGFEPGPMVGKIYKKCIEWQDRGSLNSENWVTMVKGNKWK